MSCPPVIVAPAPAVCIVNGNAPGVSVTGGPALRVVAPVSSVQVIAASVAPVIIEVCKQGPTGPPGTTDFVCIERPDATLTYAAGRLTRVDYADGRYKTLTYVGSQLITVACVDPGVETATKTLGYTGSQLTSVSTVVT